MAHDHGRASRARRLRQLDDRVAMLQTRADELRSQAAAEARATAIIARGETAAKTLMRDADDYCDRRLADFEIDLGRINAQVTAGRAKLAARLSDNIQAAPAGDADHTG